MKILFSPIGNTDPISDSNFYDGAMLHICRHYDIDKVYMYMSKKIYEKEEADQRFTIFVEKLSEKKGKEIEYEVWNSDIEEVYEFDKFIDEFREKIEEIMKEHPDAELYLNASSGTPGMKSAIIILGNFGEYPNTIIQVKDPYGGKKPPLISDIRELKSLKGNGHFLRKKKRFLVKSIRRENPQHLFDVNQMWAKCRDNNDITSKGNRGNEVACRSLLKIKQKEALKEHISAYDYDAALAIAKMMGDRSFTKMLDLAYHRSLLDLTSVESIEKEIGQDFTLSQDERHKKTFEYALSLDIKLKRSEYVEFVRGISPIIVELFWLVLENKESCNLSVDINAYRDGNSRQKWNTDRMIKGDILFDIINEGYKQGKKNNNFRPNDIKANDLKFLILAFSRNEILKEIVKRLRKVESRVRNLAAHEMVSLNESEIKKRTGISTVDIMKDIKELFKYSGIEIQDNDWKSYDHMNKTIISQINRD